MPTTAGRRLSAAHRQGQLRIAAQTIAAMRAIWPLLDPDDLDGTFDRWLTAAVATVAGQRATSADLAAAYLRSYVLAETGQSITPTLATAVDRQALTTSLTVTGPVSIKQAMARGVPLGRAVSVAETASAASAIRHSLDGGRGTIELTGATDRRRTGWARQLSGNACRFCESLAADAAAGDPTAAFVSHDGCGCSPVPTYD